MISSLVADQIDMDAGEQLPWPQAQCRDLWSEPVPCLRPCGRCERGRISLTCKKSMNMLSG